MKNELNSKATLPYCTDGKFVKNLCKIKKSLNKKDLSLIIFTWWMIWFRRNKTVFDDINFNEREVINLSKRELLEWENLDKMEY